MTGVQTCALPIYWAADQCFDSRMRLKISEATRRFEAEANEPDSEWAREIRLAVTRAP